MRIAASNNTECIRSCGRALFASKTRSGIAGPQQVPASSAQGGNSNPKSNQSRQTQQSLCPCERIVLFSSCPPTAASLSCSIALDQHEKQRVWRGTGVAVPRAAAQGAAGEPDRVLAQERAAAAAGGTGRCMVPTAVAWEGHRCAVGAAPHICTPDGAVPRC